MDNEELVQALIRRRKLILQLKNMVPNLQDFDSDNLEDIVSLCPRVPRWKKFLCFASLPQDIYFSIQKEELIIQDLSKKQYSVSSVFIIFETEQSHRDVLHTMSLPLLRQPLIDQHYKFNGITLDITSTEEPDAIRWQDLNVPLFVSCLHLIDKTCIFIDTALILLSFSCEQNYRRGFVKCL